MVKQKKIISLILSVIMLFSIVSVADFSAFAQDDVLSYLTYEINNGEVTITACNNSISGDVVIPDTIEGYPVTSIGDNAFAQCHTLTNIVIPESVTSIGEGAFYYCFLLTSVTIPNSVTSIGVSAFEACQSLANITIPNSVTSIGDYVFQDCYSLKSVTIPNSVISIGDMAFYNCLLLASVTIPDSVISIGENAFYCNAENLEIYIYNPNIKLSKNSISNVRMELENVTVDEFVDLYIELLNMQFSGKYPTEELAAKGKELNDTVGEAQESQGNTVIHGYKDSTAEAYATANDITFVPLDESEDYTACTEHSYGEWETVTAATCTENGLKKRVCSACGQIETEEIEATGHTEETIPGCAATCTETGLTDGIKCSVCGETLTAQTEIEATGHTEETIPGCAATCTETGLTDGVKCSVCGETLTAQTEIESSGHNKEHITIASTCKVAGMEYDICLTCFETFNSNALPLADHAFGEWIITVQATFTNEGERTRTCSVCGKVETETIPKLVAENEYINEDTGVSISVSSDSYDKDIKVEVSHVYDGESFQLINAQIGNVSSMIFDITPTIDGEKVQPNGKVLVKIPVPAGYNVDCIVVYYVPNDGSALVKMDSYIKNGYVCFETDHFSEYAIVDISELVDENNKNEDSKCSCNCHSDNVIVQFFNKIVFFFRRLFGMTEYRYCDCGGAHW